ncbi:MAG: dUTP diphosphatase [Candidatus Pacearchaeota archaeon]|nr:dUTP diphosphatase [Candidatus Pacearchaeota archaeon]
MIEIKIKKIYEDAILPKYSKEGDAAMDVFAQNMTRTDKYIEYGTGLSFELPKGYVMLVFPRSSVSNKDLMMKNSVGVLDSGYRGELKLRFQNNGNDIYKIGERVGQIMVLPYPEIKIEEVDELNDSERGNGGFGSTGS